MFNQQEIENVLNDIDVKNKYKEYNNLPNPGYEIDTKELDEWVYNISLGESNGIPLKELVLGVIEAAIFNRSYSLEQLIRMADEDSTSRIERSNLDPDLKQKLINNNSKTNAFLQSGSVNKNNIIPPTGEKQDSDSSNNPATLTLEDQFSIKRFESQVSTLSKEESKELLVNMFKHHLHKEATYKSLLKKNWGINTDAS